MWGNKIWSIGWWLKVTSVSEQKKKKSSSYFDSWPAFTCSQLRQMQQLRTETVNVCHLINGKTQKSLFVFLFTTCEFHAVTWCTHCFFCPHAMSSLFILSIVPFVLPYLSLIYFIFYSHFTFSWFYWWIWPIPSVPCQWETISSPVKAHVSVSITSQRIMLLLFYIELWYGVSVSINVLSSTGLISI